MFIDSRHINQNEIIECDICVVGAGAAGITLAHEFCDLGMKVILLESGDIKHDEITHQLSRGEFNSGSHSPLEANRSRQFGGTTVVWGGRCVPFDPIDFEVRPHVPHSGWPITKDDLEPYYELAHAYCDIGPYCYSVQGSIAPPDSDKQLIPGFESDEISVEGIYRFSLPTNFGKKYLNKLKQSTNIQVFLHANCLKIITDEEGQNVISLQVSSLRKNIFSIHAKDYILAAGGLEVTRLLLLSRDVHPEGIGNHYGLLGRYYMGHLNSYIDIELPQSKGVIWGYEKTREGVYCQRSVAISKTAQEKHNLLNQRAYMERSSISDPAHQNGVLSATYLAKGLVGRQFTYNQPHKHMQNIALNFSSIIDFASTWVTKRILSQRKLPSVIVKPNSTLYSLRIDSEQAPNYDSQITLSSKKDQFGLNQLKVNWQHTELDILSIKKSIELIDKILAKNGIGKVGHRLDISPVPQGGHYLGTTRMANSPQQGVVDQNCRVHGLSNLYIASGSVFPTSSYANPTLTIVALAIRLADFLKRDYR